MNGEFWKTCRKTCEIYFNVINHIFIAATAIYVTWYCYRMGFTTYTWHVWLSTIGYQLLMTEAILTLYTNNCWSFFHAPATKRNLHWIIQVAGSTFAILGTALLFPTRKQHFVTIHSITGIVSIVLCVVALLNGIMALWSQEFYRATKLRPVISKWFHNFIGIASFVIGMVSLYYGYRYGYFNGMAFIDANFTEPLIWVLYSTMILSLIGALQSLFSQSRTILRI